MSINGKVNALEVAEDMKIDDFAGQSVYIQAKLEGYAGTQGVMVNLSNAEWWALVDSKDEDNQVMIGQVY
jgi:hypothetical protein